ncbi:MAG: 1-acyl-sn-glycerol-3-phosphate acyltransferase, partial [Nanoarchaeota archaeon]
ILDKGAKAKDIIDKANAGFDQKIAGFSVWSQPDFPRTTTLKVRKFVVKEWVRDEGGRTAAAAPQDRFDAILARLTSKTVRHGVTLEQLGLSSLDRVELASLLEQEFGIELDEDRITPTTKVGEVEAMVTTVQAANGRSLYGTWQLSWPARTLRFVVQHAFIFPFVRLFARPRIIGSENLDGVRGPLLFVCNHQSHFDVPFIFDHLPHRYSHRIAVAAWQEYFFDENLRFRYPGMGVLFHLTTALINLYPLPHLKGFRRALRFTGHLVDHDWNILIFPEGRRRTSGPILPFMPGIGLFATELRIPVVPLKLLGIEDVLPNQARVPRFGDATLIVGRPLSVKGLSTLEATQRIEEAVRRL